MQIGNCLLKCVINNNIWRCRIQSEAPPLSATGKQEDRYEMEKKRKMLL